MSYPDVVEDSISQERDVEKSLQVLVEGEINLSTISKALSDASVSADPHHFVTLFRNSLKSRLQNQERGIKPQKVATMSEDLMGRENTPDTKVCTTSASTQNTLHTPDQPSTTGAATNEYSTTPKIASSQSVGKIRRNLSGAKSHTKPVRLLSDPGSVQKLKSDVFAPSQTVPVHPVSSVSEPPTPRDTPTPPLTKAVSVPFNLNNTNALF